MNLERRDGATSLTILNTLSALCDDLAFGRSADTNALYDLTREGAAPSALVRLAEAFGMMLVKVEARDYGNANLIAELTRRNQELEEARQRLAEHNAHLLFVAKERAANVIGTSLVMRRAVDLALSIARRPINTLITGPTGTGKDVIARLIHFSSPRREGPYIAVNCTAIPDSLFESEMFGIAKGVATGVEKRRGLVEEASGGTLFLDEIGDMSLPNQAKLLRVLEEREVVPVGMSKPVPVDIKVISATNARLAEAVKAGKFREDLYYRLNVAEIHLAPLKERGDDVLLLAQTFVNRHCDQMRRPRITLAPDARDCLMAYAWPGNVRELNNEMERVAALTEGNLARRTDLSPRLRSHMALPEAVLPVLSSPGLPDPEVQGQQLQERRIHMEALHVPSDHVRALAVSCVPRVADETAFNLHAAEDALIRQALVHTGGNQSRAAALLGITREGLRKKLLRQRQAKEE